MAYSQAIVQRAMQRLQSENEQNEQSSRARIAAIYEKEPRLGEIERELRRTAAHVLAATFRRQGDPVAAMQQLKKDNLALQQERDWILQAEGLEPDDLTVQPLCPKCSGTGYVGAQMCECLKELCRQEQKKELAALFGSESFDRFRLDLYPAQYDERLKTSPRTLMERTYRDTASAMRKTSPAPRRRFCLSAQRASARHTCPPASRGRSPTGAIPSAMRRWRSCWPRLRPISSARSRTCHARRIIFPVIF